MSWLGTTPGHLVPLWVFELLLFLACEAFIVRYAVRDKRWEEVQAIFISAILWLLLHVVAALGIDTYVHFNARMAGIQELFSLMAKLAVAGLSTFVVYRITPTVRSEIKEECCNGDE